MKNKLFKFLNERKDFLEEWLRRSKKVRDVEQDVIQMLEVTQWQISALSGMPSKHMDSDFSKFTIHAERDNQLIENNYPWMPNYKIYPTAGTVSITTSSSSDFYNRVVGPAEYHPLPEVEKWAIDYTKSYFEIQDTQKRVDVVWSFLEKLNPDRIDEFVKAKKSVSSVKVGNEDRSKAGNDMRNLLNHFKGDLFEKAREIPKENMTWEKMVERLAIGVIKGPEYKELLNQKNKWRSLKVRLSDISKNQELGYATNIESVWRQLIDFIYTIQGLIK